MSTLYIRLPSQALAGTTPHWPGLSCPYALVTEGKASHGKEPGSFTIERQGVMPLSDLTAAIASAQRVLLLLAAADVTLLRVKVPPLSRARLKSALPNLVEDRLIGDPSACVLAAGGAHDGLRTVAVVQRTWLEHLATTLIALGARRLAALPAQLCLACHPAPPDQAGQSEQTGQPGITAAIDIHDTGIGLTLRLSEHDGLGLTIGRQAQQTAAHEAIRTLRAIAPEAPITLLVPQAELPACQQAANDAPGNRISVSADNWAHWITGCTTPDLMDGLGAAAGPGFDWRAWRWPLALAAAVMLINIAALNFDWWRKKTEADAQRVAMTRIYQAAYPKETVIIDPIAQIQQKIAAAKRAAGLPLPDDFIALAAAFGEAWAGAMQGRPTLAIAALEYRERGLIVQLKTAPSREEGTDTTALTQQIKTLLAERGLSLEQTTSGAVPVWQIRSIK